MAGRAAFPTSTPLCSAQQIDSEAQCAPDTVEATPLMDPTIFHNGELKDARSVGISPASAGLLYGWGVFSTLRIYDGHAFAADYHWERLERNAEKMRLALPVSREQFESAVGSVISASSRRKGRVRVTILSGERGAWRIGKGSASDILIFSAAEPQQSQKDVAITISPYRILSSGMLTGVKQTAMVEHAIAYDEARSRGFDEGIMLNERGEIVGATAANIFWVEGDELFTPSPATGCVPGITRRLVCELAVKWNLHVVEGSFQVSRLLSAREVFLTSTMREIGIVGSFDAKEYDSREARITGLLSRQFREQIRRGKGREVLSNNPEGIGD